MPDKNTPFCTQVFTCLGIPPAPSQETLSKPWPVKQAEKRAERAAAERATERERETEIIARRGRDPTVARPKLKGMNSENIKTCVANYTRAELVAIARQHHIEASGPSDALCVRLLAAGLLDV